VNLFGTFTQRSRYAATLGWMIQSVPDWGFLRAVNWERRVAVCLERVVGWADVFFPSLVFRARLPENQTGKKGENFLGAGHRAEARC